MSFKNTATLCGILGITEVKDLDAPPRFMGVMSRARATLGGLPVLLEYTKTGVWVYPTWVSTSPSVLSVRSALLYIHKTNSRYSNCIVRYQGVRYKIDFPYKSLH